MFMKMSLSYECKSANACLGISIYVELDRDMCPNIYVFLFICTHLSSFVMSPIVSLP